MSIEFRLCTYFIFNICTYEHEELEPCSWWNDVSGQNTKN